MSCSADHDHTDVFDQVLRKELEFIKQHRDKRNDTSQELHGLALSGGGIRSASFALGVMQALDQHNVFRRIDYLSTVSGGGYIGASLTWFMRKGRTDFPFGKKGLGARSQASNAKKANTPEPNAILSFIRQHGNYLNPRRGFRLRSLLKPDEAGAGRARVGMYSLAAVMVRNLILCLFVYGSLLVGVFSLLKLSDCGIHAALGDLPWSFTHEESSGYDTLFLLLAFLLGLFTLVSVGYLIVTFIVHCGPPDPQKKNLFARYSYRLRLSFQSLNGWLLLRIVVLLVLASVPVVAEQLAGRFRDPQASGLAAAFATIAGALIGFLRFRQDLVGKGEGQAKRLEAALTGVLPSLAAFLLIYGLLHLAYFVAHALPGWWQPVLLVALGLAAGVAFGINFIGVNRFYRDRLMETFLPDWEAVRDNAWQPAFAADTTRLSEVCKCGTCGPYHLINANLVTVDSKKSKFRGRGGDSFILSTLYCGGDATGWRSTSDWMDNGLSLASSMAISGAAVNPNTGVGGRGPTRNRLLSMVMALLNLRLGYWARNPNPAFAPRCPRLPASLLYPGLWQGVIGLDLNEEKPFVELTDGGHFDNLGLYELIRREMDVIIVSDASADPNFRFGALACAVERVRVDFGVNIQFDQDVFGLSALLPGSAGKNPATEKYKLAAHGFALAKIEYRDENGKLRKTGHLIFIKSTMTPGLPADVLGYKDQHPEFPDQGTADQFFDEEQFEAYRELGYQLADQALDHLEKLGGNKP